MISSITSKTVFFLLFINAVNFSYAQTNQWTWVKGDNTPAIAGIYGTKGIASIANKPGSRRLSVSWTDALGNFWLFGGNGYDAVGNAGYLNDLWKYSPSTNEWTWVSGDNTSNVKGIYGTQGMPGAANKPGGRRRCTSWVDKSSNLWLFGGNGYDATTQVLYLNDLWKYDITLNQWTWVKGDTAGNINGVYGTQGTASPINKPGARYGSASWTDTAGRLWLFGGLTDTGTGQQYLNDLWNYNILTNQWTWMKGDNVTGVIGVYGVKGVSAAANKPGARVYTTSWTDSSNNLWLFGGNASTLGYLNDLWKYNTNTNEWTWVKGDNTADVAGIYGTKGISAMVNNPGAREYAVSWKDVTGNLWLFGGYGFSASGKGHLNDLWKYNTRANEWTWVKGDNITDIAGVYGSPGMSSAITNPGAREYSVGWKDLSGNLWLFGGDAYYQSNQRNYLNDLWKYMPAATCNPNTWTGNINGEWNNAANWSCNILPAAGADVIIPSTAHQPLINSPITVGNFNLEGVFNLNGQMLTINGTVTGSGTISGSNTSTIIINGNAGDLQFTNGAAILHSLILNTGGSVSVSSNLIITGQ